MAAKTLTDKAVIAAKPGVDKHGRPARAEVRDALVRGLRLVVQPTGNRSWAFRYVTGKADRKLSLGDYPAVSLDAARTAARVAAGDVAAGRDPAAERATARAPANTVAASFEAYDAGHLKSDKVTPDTAAGTRSFFNRRVIPVWEHRPIGSISRQDVVALLDGLRGFKDASRKAKTRLSHFFSWTMDRNATVTANPAAGVKVDGSKSRERVLADDELRAVWKACDNCGTFGAMVRVLILTMARRSEVAEMPRAELSESTWSIDGSRTKNGRPMDIHRTTFFDSVLSDLLGDRHGNKPFVFEGRHHDRPIGGFSDLKSNLDDVVGDGVAAPWTLHDLRRTGASLMQRIGVPFEVREACLNHTIKGVAGTYNRHQYKDEKTVAFDALAREVERIVTRAESNIVAFTR